MFVNYSTFLETRSASSSGVFFSLHPLFWLGTVLFRKNRGYSSSVLVEKSSSSILGSVLQTQGPLSQLEDCACRWFSWVFHQVLRLKRYTPCENVPWNQNLPPNKKTNSGFPPVVPEQNELSCKRSGWILSACINGELAME